MMKITTFPHHNNSYSSMLSEGEIKIDGMKVIFDKKTGLVPVNIEKEVPKSIYPKPSNN